MAVTNIPACKVTRAQNLNPNSQLSAVERGEAA